jgi:hypothetical protein
MKDQVDKPTSNVSYSPACVTRGLEYPDESQIDNHI